MENRLAQLGKLIASRLQTETIDVKMLLKIPKQSFHPVAVKRHTRALAQKMQAESFDQAMPFDIEFLPNEVVWDLAMEAIS